MTDQEHPQYLKKKERKINTTVIHVGEATPEVMI